MIIPKHYENLNMLHENTMPYRSYYVPASARMGALVHDREKSDRIEFLNENGNSVSMRAFMTCRKIFMKKAMIQMGLGRYLYRGSGRISAMTSISIPMYVIRFPLIRHTFHRTTHAGHMFMSLSMKKMNMHQKHI